MFWRYASRAVRGVCQELLPIFLRRLGLSLFQPLDELEELREMIDALECDNSDDTTASSIILNAS